MPGRARQSALEGGAGPGAEAGAAEDELDEGGGGARQGAVGAVDQAQFAPQLNVLEGQAA